MKVTFKLFAALAEHLPAGARDNAVDLDVPDDATVGWLLDEHRLPPRLVHLVLVNGVYCAPDARGARALGEGDTVAVWPPIAGG